MPYRLGQTVGDGPVVESPHDEELAAHARKFVAFARCGDHPLHFVRQGVGPGDLDAVGDFRRLGVERKVAGRAVGPHHDFGPHEPALFQQRLRRLGLGQRGEAARIVAPLALVVDQVEERIGAPESRGGALGVERSEQDAVDRAVGIDPALGNGILVGVHRLRREGHAVVVEEVTLGDFDPRQAVVDGFELRRNAAQRIACGVQRQHSGHGGLVVDDDPLAQEIVRHGVRSRLALQGRQLARSLRKRLLLAGEHLLLAHLVEQIAVGVALVVENRVPRRGERVGQRAVHALQGVVTLENLHRLGLGLHGGVGFGQLGQRAMVGEIAVDIVHGPHLLPLRVAQGRIILRREVFAEIEVVHQIADLQRVGDRLRRAFFSRRRRLLRRAVQAGQHPLLLDGVDTVDQASLGIADFENPAFELQNLLRILLPLARVLAQLPAHALHGVDDRILAYLQLRILAEQRHVLGVSLQPRNAGFDLGLLRPHSAGG